MYRQQLIDTYTHWSNNCISIEEFAKDHDLSIKHARALIELARSVATSHNTLEHLIEAVEAINEEAASYLRSNYDKLIWESGEGDLSSVMIWGSTPQGYKYWDAIYNKLYHKENEAC